MDGTSPVEKNKGGRPPGGGFKPTPEHRQMVEVGAAIGLTEAELCLAIINPDTGKPIDLKTLRLHFREELDTGHVRAHMKVGAGLFKNATTATAQHPGGNPVCQFFWLKCRLRWRQNHDQDEGEPPPTVERANELEVARRVMFVLEMGARSKGEPTPKPQPPRIENRKREVA